MKAEPKDSSESADDALLVEEIDELEYEGRLGGFLSDRSAIYLRFYPDGVLDGVVRQRKKPQLSGLKLLSTSRKRKLPSESELATNPERDDTDSVLCAHIQGRWLRRRDGYVCNFHAMRRLGHVDRHTLTCRAELLTDGRATGTWCLSGEKTKNAAALEEGEDEGETETEDETLIENVFEWTRVERNSCTRNNNAVSSSDPLAVYPLTPGTYHFRGFTTYHVPETPRPRTKQTKGKTKKAPPRDECFVTMELLPDGRLTGTSQEVAYPQSCPIQGTWELGRIRYVLEYKVREAIGYFKYSARVSDVDQLTREGEAARTLKGKWRNIDDDETTTPGYAGGRGHFELICVHRSSVTVGKSEHVSSGDHRTSIEEDAKKDAQRSSAESDLVVPAMRMRVFTTGSYVLKGKAVDEDGYEYESQLEIHLLDDGTVCGTCQELVFHQVQRLRGNWSKTRIRYELEYVVKREVGHYWYDGSLDSEGLVIHGEWCNMELLLDEGQTEQKASYRGEKGTFSYAIIEATRRWSHASHFAFPQAFRDRVRCILLCSQRMQVLPSALWSKIFAFCGHDWFHTPVQT